MTSALTRRLYVIAWLVLGGIALGYFYTLFGPPPGSDSIQRVATVFSRSASPNETPEVADPAISQAVARMSSEIESLKRSLEAARKENAALQAHIKTLEATYGQSSTAALPPQSARPDRNVFEPGGVFRDAFRPGIEVTLLPMPVDGFAEDVIESPLPIAGIDEPRRTQFAVQIAVGLRPGEIETRWAELNRRHPLLLAELQPRKVAGGKDSYKLIVGPFNNAAAAAMLCARLTAAGTACEGTMFAGSPVGGVAAR